MTGDFQLINHCLFNGILIFFAVGRALDRELFDSCIKLLQDKAKVALPESALTAYWKGITERMAGSARWDRFAPVIDRKKDFIGWAKSFNSIDNILLRRPYTTFSISGVKYLLEVFNPCNELGIRYPGAGEPVIALIMKEEAYGNIFDRLSENSDFYEIIRGIDSICPARIIVGMNSGNLSSLMRAYFDKTINPSVDPWSFLFPLQVMKLPKHVGAVALKRYFKKIEDWGDGRWLLQVKSGIDFTINRQNDDAAKLLGMTPVQDLNPDILKQRNKEK